jgi:hypothetical protein
MIEFSGLLLLYCGSLTEILSNPAHCLSANEQRKIIGAASLFQQAVNFVPANRIYTGVLACA